MVRRQNIEGRICSFANKSECSTLGLPSPDVPDIVRIHPVLVLQFVPDRFNYVSVMTVRIKIIYLSFDIDSSRSHPNQKITVIMSQSRRHRREGLQPKSDFVTTPSPAVEDISGLLIHCQSFHTLKSIRLTKYPYRLWLNY